VIVDKEEQLTPLETEDIVNKINNHSEHNINIGETVKIKSIKKEALDPEDYYYLKKFENRIGTICEQNECKSGVFTYKVDFGKNGFGYFYHEDFILINEDKPN
jgi:hypothetical protein